MTRIYFVSGMFCGSCAKAVEKRVQGLCGVQTASVSFSSRLLRITLDPAASVGLNLEIERSLRQAGFGVQLQTLAWLPAFLDQLRDEQ